MQRQSAIEEEYSNAESLHIAIASANGLQFLNGTIHPFGLAVVAPHAESIDDALLMTVEHFDDLGYFWDIGSQRTLTPHHVKRKRLGPVQLSFDDITEVFLDAPCTGHFVVRIDNSVKLDLLLVCESGGILQEEVSRPLEVFVGLHFPSAHGINGSIEVFDQMELVVADGCQRHQLLDCIPERIPHVDTCGKHVCSLDRIQSLANQRLRIFLLPASDNFKHRSVIIIEDTGEVTSVHGLLIYMYMVMLATLLNLADKDGDIEFDLQTFCTENKI